MFVELPCIFTLVSVVYAGMPELVVSLYHSLLQFSGFCMTKQAYVNCFAGPLALILVSIQLPRIVMFTSRLLCEKIDEQPTTMKVSCFIVHSALVSLLCQRYYLLACSLLVDLLASLFNCLLVSLAIANPNFPRGHHSCLFVTCLCYGWWNCILALSASSN